MEATDPPKGQERGRPKKRRYFRRRRRKNNQEASMDAEGGADGGSSQQGQRERSRKQGRRRNESRRRSSRRRSGSAGRGPDKGAPVDHEENLPPTEVYVYTHVLRPRNRDSGGGEFHAEHSLNLSGATVSAPIGMDGLLESIGRQLDAWFAPEAKVIEGDGEQRASSAAASASEDGSDSDDEVPGGES